MVTAYVLINCDLRYKAEVVDKLKQLEDVKEVNEVFGAYDILAKVKSHNMENLTDTITWEIRKLYKVSSTLTLMTIEGQE